MLLVMARMSILLDNYERATQELEDICIDKFNPAQLFLFYYLKVVTEVVAGVTEGILNVYIRQKLSLLSG